MAWFKNNWFYLLFFLFLILITYGNSINNVFLSDDIAEISQNPNLGNFNNIFNHPFGFIRPFLYWLTFHIGGLNPTYFRLINIFFHIGSVFLIYFIFKLISSKKLALFVAAVFAVHPAISEAVVWISGGGYPQYAFFFLLSFFLYLLSKNNKKYYWWSVIAFLCSFMSHAEMSLALFLIFPLWELAFGNLKKNWVKVVPFFLLSMVYLLIIFNSIPNRVNTLQNVHYQERGIDNPFVLIPIALSSYFELIFFPKTLTLYHSEIAFSKFEFAIRALVTIIFLVIAIFSFKKNKFIFFWSSFFLITLSTTLTPFRLNWIVAERYLYLPSLGILAIVGFGLEKLSKSHKFKWVSYTLFIVIVTALSIRTVIRNVDWKNEDNLWIATGKTSPSSPNNHNNLGDVYGRRGDKKEALREFQTAIALKPNYADAYHNMANTYMELNQPEKALENYQKALQFNPNLWQSYQNIASIYFNNKQYDLTIENIEKAITLSPNNINLRNNLGVIYFAKGDKQKAKEIFNLVLSVDPQNKYALSGLAEASK